MTLLPPTLAAAVERHARTIPETLAVVDARGELSYARLAADARTFAGSLQRLGFRRGDVVSVQLPNWNEFVVAAVACSYGGFVFSPLSIRYRRAEIAHALATSGSRALIVPDAYRGFDHAALTEELHADFPSLHRIVVGQERDGCASFASLLDGPAVVFEPGDRDAPALILLTSGTEGPSKLVVHGEASLMAASAAMIERGRIGAGEVVLIGIPISTSAGNHGLARNGLIVGGTLVLLEHWEAEAAARLIAERGCSYTLAPTSVLFDLVRLPAAAHGDLRSLRLFICGGAPIPRVLVREAREVLGCAVTPMYGASECLAATTCAPDDPDELVAGTDGLPLPGVEVRVFDEAGDELPVGSVGELGVRGPTLFLGYLDDPQTIRRPLHRGWWLTGDIGVVDERGYVHVVDRKKDIVVRGGVNISSKEVEEALIKHPKIVQAAVVGMPDDRLGQRVCAFVVGSDVTLAEVGAHIEALGLAREKTPEHLELVDELPLNLSGKVQKEALRGRAAEIAAGATR